MLDAGTEPIELRCRFAEDFFAEGLWDGAAGLSECGKDLLPGTGEAADGPVAAEHEAIRGKEAEDVLDVGAKVVWFPGFVVGLRDHAGEFAVHARDFGDDFEVAGNTGSVDAATNDENVPGFGGEAAEGVGTGVGHDC